MRRYVIFTILGMLVLASSLMAAEAAFTRNGLAGDSLRQYTPATHYIWTDKIWYNTGGTVNLYWTADAQGDAYPYTIFIKLQNVETGATSYVANNAVSQSVVDAFGNAEGNFAPTRIPTVSKQKMLSFSAPGSAGYWQFVAELRDVTGRHVVKSAFAKFAVVTGVVELGAGLVDTEIASDTTWTRDKVYRLRYQVFVNPGATLTIEPGTVVVAQGQNAVLVVERGGKIIADGRREMPIIMTCDGNVGQRFSGCWAGLIMLGAAKINVTGGEEAAEGVIPADRPRYGGTNDDDSSGVLRYVRVEFAGVDVTAEIQPNAFGFHGIGRGTVIDDIQAHDGEDDGIEFFGGTVNASHVVSDGSKDDAVDWTHGWTGKVQWVYIRQDNVEADNGLEMDNWEFGHDNTPRANPRIFNATLIGSPAGTRGGRLRRGSAIGLRNFIIADFPGVGWQVDDDATFAQIANGATDISRGIFWMNNGGKTDLAGQLHSGVQSYLLGQPFVTAEDPMLRNTRYEGNPDPRPMDGSPACKAGTTLSPAADGFYGQADASECRGAFNQTDNWLEEWTFFGGEEDYLIQ